MHSSAAATPAGPRTMEGESIKPSSQPPVQAGDDEKNQRTITVNPAHMGKAFKVMNELRSKQLLCDVMIVAEDVEIEAHRVVLAACSPYFCAMFTGDMSESKAKKIEIKDVDGRTLNKLIDYIYTAEIEVTEENVQVLLPAASLLQLMDVRQNCCDFLQSQLHPTNCLGIRAFADVHTCTDLLQQANAYAGKAEQLAQFLCVETIPSDLSLSSFYHTYLQEDSFKNQSQIGLLGCMVMIVVGGQAPKAIRSVECYDFEEDRWDQIAELPSRRCRAGVVFMAGHVYAVGGFNGSLRVRTVDVYDGVKDQWTSIASMQERRSTLGAAVLNDLLYAVGGFDGST
ncbi:kelch-like protein 3, partial [Leptonychotes weddellii]|uniref:Kelch-like protein 3 n=1 Tax=Leptonychotes weddellii TaxID=9713 RepID=A0A7F8R4F3_LEPWE